jgi:hypothetical protein
MAVLLDVSEMDRDGEKCWTVGWTGGVAVAGD